ncbi:inosine triphosphate pyrophosphatase-like protein [Pelagophyceae sp. CCMP2097]|nr:inosine triphosphate pyrophosphatase-like protein [Pelagophyceae sp. CCMP2097]
MRLASAAVAYLIVCAMPVAALEVSLAAALAGVTKLQTSRRLVLGSSSSPRRLLLEAAGAAFDVVAPDIDERAIGDRAGDAEALVRLVANAKADALVSRLGVSGEGRIVVTGDQVVTWRGVIREKPRDAAECREFVLSYGTAPCTTVGAICVHDLATGAREVATHTAEVHFSQMPEAFVDRLIESDGAALMKCAGGLMVEHPAVTPYVTDVRGGLDSVMGTRTASENSGKDSRERQALETHRGISYTGAA